MSRRCSQSVKLHVDIDGIEIPATLRPPGIGGRAAWHVRWLMHGRYTIRSTGETVLHEAKRVAAAIIRGERESQAPPATVLSFERFVSVQEKHYGQRANQRRAKKTFVKFHAVWKDFLRFNDQILGGRLQAIQHVTEAVAQRYLEWLKDAGAAAYGIHSKFGVLRASWNRVRKDHPKGKRTLSEGEKVTRNPWEAILGELPERPIIEPVQLDLDAGEFQKLHAAFDGRPVAQMLLVVSQWAAGRREEITHCQWDWIDDRGYIDIPDDMAKWGKGRVIRMPLAVVERLRELREPGSPLVFAGFREEYRRSSRHGKRMLPTTPERLYETVGEHISKAAKALGLEKVSHHAIRRTTMELSDQGEEIKATDESSKNLGTTTKNKDGFYVRKSHGKTFYLRADRLYDALSFALCDHPDVAILMLVDNYFTKTPPMAMEERVRRLLDEMESLSSQEILELERQKAKRR